MKVITNVGNLDYPRVIRHTLLQSYYLTSLGVGMSYHPRISLVQESLSFPYRAVASPNIRNGFSKTDLHCRIGIYEEARCSPNAAPVCQFI